MSTKRAGKLKIEASGTQHYIRVASNKSQALHAFLRANYVTAGPPQPSSSEVDSIALGRGLDLAAVEALLDRWS